MNFKWTSMALLPLCLACGASMMPSQKLSESKAAMSAAEAVNADRYPQAALHLKLARDQAQIAERLIAEEEYEQAERLLERAKADADLAFLHARAKDIEADAREAESRVLGLQAE
jgi:hypothetical protein